jgi:CHC2 zinc finger
MSERRRRYSEEQLDDLRRRVPVAEIAEKYVKLHRSAGKLVGPCPICSKRSDARDDTRFAVKQDGEGWGCASCGDGGDVIALVMRITDKPFREAVEWLGGARELAPEEAERLERDREKRRLEHERQDNEYRARERRICWNVWDNAAPLIGSTAEAYLKQLRKLAKLPPRAQIRCVEDMPYWVSDDRDHAEIIHRGPAMVAAIVGPDFRFAGVHLTYIDLSKAKGKAELRDPRDGKPLKAKKTRGSAGGGHLILTNPVDPERLIGGEGIETTAAVWLAHEMCGRDNSRTAYWPFISMGNMAGKAKKSVTHPTLRGDKGRPRRVQGPEPDMDSVAVPIPESVTELVLLGDSDSDPFITQCAMARAGARYAKAGRKVRVAWAPPEHDFADLL